MKHLISNEDQTRALEIPLEKGDNEKIKWADEKLIKCLGFNE